LRSARRILHFAVAFAALAATGAAAQEVDLAILGGTVVDGRGAEPFVADILVDEGRIVLVGEADPGTLTAAHTIDARGLLVTPGFIDAHAHGNPLVDASFANFLRQGFTTVVLGQDGVSPPDERVTYTDNLDLEAWRTAMMGGPVAFAGPATLGQWLDAVDERGVEVNVAALSGHGTNRLLVGAGSESPLTEAQQLAAEEILRADLAAGAFGLSSGLEYIPGRYADKEELVRLARIVGQVDGVVMSHMRSEDDDRIADAIEELIAQGRHARVSVSHLKVVYGQTVEQAEAVLAQLASARANGVEIHADAYPYYAGYANMVLVYPDWAKRKDQWDDAVANRRGELERALIARVNKRNGPSAILIASGEFAGKTLAEVAAELGLPFEQVLIDQFGYGGPLAAHRIMSEETQDVFIADADVALSSDGGPWISHPRSWGSAPELLARFVRDKRLLPIESAVRKLSALPADILGLADRGRIAQGLVADLNIIDLARLENRASWTDHAQPPAGYRAVIVNGIMAFDGKQVLESRAGRTLRRQVSGR